MKIRKDIERTSTAFFKIFVGQNMPWRRGGLKHDTFQDR
jgi:hypothetical protein